MANVILWCLAFLGIVVIYAARPVLKIFGSAEPAEPAVITVKSIGIFLSAAALIILYMTGGLS